MEQAADAQGKGDDDQAVIREGVAEPQMEDAPEGPRRSAPDAAFFKEQPKEAQGIFFAQVLPGD